MSDEFRDLPNIENVLAQRIAAKAGQPIPAGTVDPYQMMLNKKQQGDTPIQDTPPVVKWPEADVKKLEDYCQKRGIVGFNPGRMPPLVAMAMLKRQLGEDYTDVPLEDRVPEGYEKIVPAPKYSPKFPYSQAMANKQILHG
jgi:hypothetical protein